MAAPLRHLNRYVHSCHRLSFVSEFAGLSSIFEPATLSSLRAAAYYNDQPDNSMIAKSQPQAGTDVVVSARMMAGYRNGPRARPIRSLDASNG
jgi:hypothetical protein